MRDEVQSELATRLLDHIADDTTDLAPHLSVRGLDGYRDADTYRRELDRIFQRRPFIVAHVAQFPASGHYLATDLFGIPVLLMRNGEDIKGYVNLCRHRGTRLVDPGYGRAAADGFTCPWHGWRYDLSGGLCAIPDHQRGFPGLDLTQRGLLPLHTEIRHGFVWITVGAAGSTGVADYLGPLDQEFADHELDTYLYYNDTSRSGGFNWKLGIEAFLETYHFRWLHPAMKKYVLSPDLSLVDRMGEHVRLIAPKRSVLENRDLAPAERRVREHATLAYILFPSTVVFVEKRHVTVMSMRPTAPDACDVRFLNIVQEDTLTRRDYWDENIGKFMDAAAEDFGALEAAQSGFGRPGTLRAPGHESVVFGRNEWGLQLFRNIVDTVLIEES